MKLSALLASAGFLCLTALGVGVTTQVYVNNAEGGANEVVAAEAGESFTFTLDCSRKISVSDSEWATGGSVFVDIYSTGTGDNALNGAVLDSSVWSAHSGWGNDHYWCKLSIRETTSWNIEIPYAANATHVIVGSLGDNSQSSDISLDLVKAHVTNKTSCKLVMQDTWWEFKWDLVSSPVETSPDTMRVWVKRAKDYTSTDYITTWHYWSNDGTVDAEIGASGYIEYASSDQGGNTYLAYYDVPTAISTNSYHYQVKAYNKTTGGFVYATTDSQYEAGNNTKLLYVHDNGTDFNWGVLDNKSDFNTATMAPKILEAYYTCRNSVDNGYLAAAALETTWFTEIGTALTDSMTVTDFEYKEGYDYTTDHRNVDVGALTKLNAMKELQTANTAAGAFANIADNSVLFGTIIAVASLSLVGGSIYLISRRRREN